MQQAIDAVFAIGAAGYITAAGFAGMFLGSGNRRLLAPLVYALVVGGVCLVFTFGMRCFMWRRLPLTTAGDALNLLVLLATAAVLPIARKERAAALLSFYAPALAALYAANGLFFRESLRTAPRLLRGGPLLAHVGMAFLAYALLLLAGVTSVAYVLLARRLKRGDTTGLFQHLPSLEELDRSLWGFVRRGYALFSATLLVGVAWAWLERDLLGDRWWISPKVSLSFVMVIFYAVCFHARRSGWLRGPRLAYWVLVGFALLFGLYVALELAGLRTYHFWGETG